jgi:hypothetical protein
MPYFIKHTVRTTTLVYLVKAETPEDVRMEDGKYLGYFDGDTDPEKTKVFGPFSDLDTAEADQAAGVDGK